MMSVDEISYKLAVVFLGIVLALGFGFTSVCYHLQEIIDLLKKKGGASD